MQHTMTIDLATNRERDDDNQDGGHHGDQDDYDNRDNHLQRVARQPYGREHGGADQGGAFRRPTHAAWMPDNPDPRTQGGLAWRRIRDAAQDAPGRVVRALRGRLAPTRAPARQSHSPSGAIGPKNRNLHLRFRRMDLVAKLNAVAGGMRLRPHATEAA